MSREDQVGILKRHKLRITNCRLDVIDRFLRTGYALSLGDLEKEFADYDRVTLYRTLNSFLEAGILHKIPNELGSATYGLCHATCTPQEHKHNHIHFKCNICGKMECLDQEVVQSFSLPQGYSYEAVNLIVDGVCSDCG